MSGTFFVILIVLAVVAVIVRKPRRVQHEDEPWRASLNEGDDEPLDMEEARRAEEEWEKEGSLEWEEDEEGWSG